MEKVLVAMLLKIVFDQSVPFLEVKLVNREPRKIYFQNNLDYHVVETSNGGSYCLVYVLRNPNRRVTDNFHVRTIWRDEKRFSFLSENVDTNSAFSLLKESWFWPRSNATRRRLAKKYIDQHAKILSIAPGDTFVYRLLLHPKLFLKSSYCNHGIPMGCPDFEDDSLQLYTIMNFKYYFDPKAKAKDLSFMHLNSDTLTFGLK